MEGENFVSLKGYVSDGSLKVVGDNNFLFKGKLKLPINNMSQVVKVAAWGNIAESIGELPFNTFIHVHGHIEESSYKSNCRFCKSPETKYWTEVIIDNFMVID